ncbi:hypothetical protein LCGC14_1281340 [marine sediment metagenome]|uniref:Uncharacterized protein n=1 Tax=marine sediment metagenome TaxID=412755 RepID=A0A0F9KWP8_9ZZZZ
MAQQSKWKRKWADHRNAVGFAAGCARLALPFYRGDRRSDAVAAIEVAEKYVAGDQIDTIGVADAAYDVAYDADDADAAATYAATAAAAYVAARAAYAAAAAAYWADKAGVDNSEIAVLYARWTVRDLGCGKVDEQTRQAAGAAIIAGDENLAKELLAG